MTRRFGYDRQYFGSSYDSYYDCSGNLRIMAGFFQVDYWKFGYIIKCASLTGEYVEHFLSHRKVLSLCEKNTQRECAKANSLFIKGLPDVWAFSVMEM